MFRRGSGPATMAPDTVNVTGPDVVAQPARTSSGDADASSTSADSPPI